MVNVGYFLKFKSIISGNTLISISNTNINEVLEFGKSYLNVSSLAVFSVFLAAVFMGGKYVFSRTALYNEKILYSFIILVLIVGIYDYGHRLYIAKTFADYKYIKKKKEQFKAIALNKKENFDYTINAMLVILGHMY